MTMRDLTAEEWLTVREIRARKMTGYHVHTRPFGAKVGDGRPRSFYIWKMGMQPGEALIKALSAGCPLRAAAKFLAIYAPNTPDCSGSFDCYREPRVRATQP